MASRAIKREIGNEKSRRRQSMDVDYSETKKMETAPNDRGEQLTLAEKMMLDFLLEKEKKGRRSASEPPRPILMAENRIQNHETPSPSRRVRFAEQSPKSMKFKKTNEDRSVVRALDQLDKLSDDQMERLYREYQDEDPDNDAEVGSDDFLAWWMTRAQFGVSKSSSSKSLGVSKSIDRNRKPSIAMSEIGDIGQPTTRSSRPIRDPDDPKRILFSFMQEPPTQRQDSTISGNLDNFDQESIGDFDLPSENLVRGRRPRFGDNVRKMRSERPRRQAKKEESIVDEEDESYCTDIDDPPDYLVGLVAPRKPKSRKKIDLDVDCWDPDQPRPMPSRLRRKMPPTSTAKLDDQKPGTSKM